MEIIARTTVERYITVLILIVMEDTHGESRRISP